MLNVLSRRGDAKAALCRVMCANHEPVKRRRRLQRRAIAVYRSLREAGIVEELPVGWCDASLTL